MSWPSGDIRREMRVARLRQAAANGATPVNGIASVEVDDSGATIRLSAELVFSAAAGSIGLDDVTIGGGVRRPRVAVTGVSIAGTTLTIDVAERGDFSIYELSLRRVLGVPPVAQLLPGFDPLLSDIPVGFRLACEQDFDCQAEAVADVPADPGAAIDYTARDYSGFRRLMLDRFAQATPGWRDPGAASPEVTLMEMLAAVADRIAYAQDAVGTEAYLDTARLRVSAKRHARLIDYRMSDGSNARAFVHVRLRAPAGGLAPLVATASIGTRFLTRARGVAPASGETPDVLAARAAGAEVFEAFEPARLSSAHNRILIHDWLEGEAISFPRGTTSLAVVDADRTVTLQPGDLLLIEEVLDREGNASPDPVRRQVVRLTEVTPAVDPVGRLVAGNPEPLEILTLRWAAADALTGALPLARVASTDTVDDIPPSADQPTLVARGNMIAVDHGEWRGKERLKAVRRPGRRRFEMMLADGPVTMAVPTPKPPAPPAAPPPSISAAETMAPAARPVAQIDVRYEGGAGSEAVWTVVAEIFDTARRELVMDIADDGRATLRTGEAASFDPGAPFVVRYRLGNGAKGNVGAEAIAHLLSDPHEGADGTLVAELTVRPGDVALVRNPLPAVGGAEPETIDHVRLRAPITFRAQDRAVTGEDYARLLAEDPIVSNARAIETWTGAARAIVLLVDLVGGGALDDRLEQRFRDRLERYRLAGHLLEFRDPALVPVELAMKVCVRAGVPREAVLARLMRLFSSRRLADGMPALFHPDNFGFGSSLRLSQLYAAAHGVDGVVHVEITALGRQGVVGSGALTSGTLDFGAYEVPVLANDPNFPDRGIVRFTMEGGA